MKYRRMLYIVFSVSMSMMLASCTQRDNYTYTPKTAGEVPATLTNRMVVNHIRNGVMFYAKIEQINGQKVHIGGYFGGTPADVTHSISPGFTAIHGFAALHGITSFTADLPIDWVLEAQPGEKYLFNGSGSPSSFDLWIEDSKGQRILTRHFDIGKR